MSRKVLVFAFATATLIGLVIWLVIGNYTPSRDGHTEEAIAMSDMRRYCQVARLDCTDLRMQERIGPVRGDDRGHWEFVVSLGEAGSHYVVGVTPGVESQIALLDSRE
jgi:hypothetical protein